MASKNKKLSIAADILGHNIEGSVRKIPINKITPSDSQPRQDKNINIEKLSLSLQEEGLLQPIVVAKALNDTYKIIAGERRFRAAVLAGWNEIECKILNKNEDSIFKLAVIENLQRENLGPLEESSAYKKLKTIFNYTDQQLADILGKSRNYISEILLIADIPDSLQKEALLSGINNKNLLVQFAHAVKNGNHKDFIDNFKAGQIQTVKSAKSFIQKHKPENKKQLKQPVLINLNFSSVDKNKIDIQIKIENIHTDYKISQIEHLIKQQITKYFS